MYFRVYQYTMSAKCWILGAWSDEPTETWRLAESIEFLDADGKCRDCYKSGQNVSWKSNGSHTCWSVRHPAKCKANSQCLLCQPADLWTGSAGQHYCTFAVLGVALFESLTAACSCPSAALSHVEFGSTAFSFMCCSLDWCVLNYLFRFVNTTERWRRKLLLLSERKVSNQLFATLVLCCFAHHCPVVFPQDVTPFTSHFCIAFLDVQYVHVSFQVRRTPEFQIVFRSKRKFWKKLRKEKSRFGCWDLLTLLLVVFAIDVMLEKTARYHDNKLRTQILEI